MNALPEFVIGLADCKRGGCFSRKRVNARDPLLPHIRLERDQVANEIGASKEVVGVRVMGHKASYRDYRGRNQFPSTPPSTKTLHPTWSPYYV